MKQFFIAWLSIFVVALIVIGVIIFAVKLVTMMPPLVGALIFVAALTLPIAIRSL